MYHIKKCILTVLIVFSFCLFGCNQTIKESGTTTTLVVYDAQQDRAYWAEYMRKNHELNDSDTKIYLKLFLTSIMSFVKQKEEMKFRPLHMDCLGILIWD